MKHGEYQVALTKSLGDALNRLDKVISTSEMFGFIGGSREEITYQEASRLGIEHVYTRQQEINQKFIDMIENQNRTNENVQQYYEIKNGKRVLVTVEVVDENIPGENSTSKYQY